MSPLNITFLFTLSIFLSACGEKTTAITGCQSTDSITAICGFQNPEDIELLPDGKTLLISQMGNMEGTKMGSLVTYHTVNQTIRSLFPLENIDDDIKLKTENNWGQSHCINPPSSKNFSPHGTSLKQREDGRWQLAVVNHGRGETVEMFELLQAKEPFSLSWRGCVTPPSGTYMNDVALFKSNNNNDIGFVASHMFNRHSPKILGLSTSVWKSQLGFNTGYVFEWLPNSPDTFRILKESHGAFMNGVEVSANGRFVFANVYAGNEIRKLDRVSGKKRGSVKAQQVDNTAWDNNGYLLAASHTGAALDQMDCIKQPGETCGFGFTILRINPETLESERIFQHEGAPMGAATIARQVGGYLYIGSFSGDRIIKIAYPK